MEVLRHAKWIAILWSMMIVSMGFSAEKGNFHPPSLKGYSFNAKWDIDWDEDKRVDTTIKNYKNTKGDSIAKLYKKGTSKIWAWSLDSYGDDNLGIIKNYTLIDTNNDGKLDTRYSMDEDIPLPSWVEK